MSAIKKITEKDFEFTHDIDENPNPDNFFMHTHEGCEFYYFISGKGAFHIEGNKYELKAGDVLIMNNTESHYIQIDPSVPYNRCVVRFEKEFINKIDSQGFLLKMYENRQPGKQNLIETARLKNDLITLLLNNMVNSSESNTMDFITTFYLILNELNKIFDSHAMISKSIKNTVASQIITYILDNVCNEITVSSICKKFYLSHSQLHRLFKKSMGTTVWDYITIKRLILAKQMIESGIHPTEVYLKCGYSDYSTFYRAYKKRFNVPPSAVIPNKHSDL